MSFKNNLKHPTNPNPTIILKKKKSSVNLFGVFIQSAAIKSRKIISIAIGDVCIYIFVYVTVLGSSCAVKSIIFLMQVLISTMSSKHIPAFWF